MAFTRSQTAISPLAAAIETIDFSEVRNQIETETLNIKIIDEAIADGERQQRVLHAKLQKIREGKRDGTAAAEALKRGEDIDVATAAERQLEDKLAVLRDAGAALAKQRRERGAALEQARGDGSVLINGATKAFVEERRQRARELAFELGQIAADCRALHEAGSAAALGLYTDLSNGLEKFAGSNIAPMESEVGQEVLNILATKAVRDISRLSPRRVIKHL